MRHLFDCANGSLTLNHISPNHFYPFILSVNTVWLVGMKVQGNHPDNRTSEPGTDSLAVTEFAAANSGGDVLYHHTLRVDPLVLLSTLTAVVQ